VLAPLWSDAAAKYRYIALPDDTEIEVHVDGDWGLPSGAVVVKEFYVGDQQVETRLVTRGEADEYRAFTYVWDAAGTDGVRRDDGAVVRTMGGDWIVPTQDECFECHTDVAGYTLGLENRQLAGTLTYSSTGRKADQLDTLASIGFIPRQDDVEPLSSYDDEERSVESLARSYLHANCSHCHRPGGATGGDADLRYQVSLAAMGVCNEAPREGDPTPEENGLLLAPGDAERSILYLRPSTKDPKWRMPTIATRAVDAVGTALVRAWIESLEACP
jgi:hypothetical protein